MMKTINQLAAACAGLAAVPCAANTLLFLDNFNTPENIGLNDADTSGRLSGVAAGETALESFAVLQDITDNELDLADSGGVRFGPETSRYDWAGSTTGTDIIDAGGFVVSFEWTHNGNSSEWLAWKVGTDNADSGVDAGSVDHALLLRQGPNGVGEDNERWDNGTNLGFSGTSYNPVAGVPTTYPVKLFYRFDSFDDASDVNLSAVVNGVEVVNDNFTWDGNAGALRMEMQSGVDGNFVDNLSLATIPVLETTIDVSEFPSGAPQGQAVGTLATASIDGSPVDATYSLVSGEGSFDNNLFQLDGDTVETGDYDFTMDPDGSTYSIRVRASSETSDDIDESVILLTVFADEDNDLLPDEWETYWSFGPLDELDGRASGEGSGAGSGDYDGDGLTDLEEYQFSARYPDLDPYLESSDGDALSDFEELMPTGDRPVTDPTLDDTDGDDLADDVETNTGVFVDSGDTGTNPVEWDSDGDGARDSFEIDQGSDPNDGGVTPPLPTGLSVARITDDASTGLDAGRTYTHAIGGGAGATVNGVEFDALTVDATPADFTWNLAGAGDRGAIADTPGDWEPETGGVTGEGVTALLNSFAFATGKDPGGVQEYVLSGLTPGQTYELSVYARTWDPDGPGRPIDMTFQNGESEVTWFRPLMEDRPDIVVGGSSPHEALMVNYVYTAEGSEVVLRGELPFTEDPSLQVTGGFHLYGLANAVVGGGGGSELRVTGVYVSAAGEVSIDFLGEPDTEYRVTRSADLSSGFTPLTTPLEVTTDGTGAGAAVVPAAETGESEGFFRIEDMP